jgi:DnaK suppressor protein
MTTQTYPDARRILLEARARLLERLAELGSDETGELHTDLEFGDGFADAAAVTSERTEALGLLDSVMKNLEDVDRALRRLDEGLYGICITCGREIGEDRLAIRPESVYCVECKSKSKSG